MTNCLPSIPPAVVISILEKGTLCILRDTSSSSHIAMILAGFQSPALSWLTSNTVNFSPLAKDASRAAKELAKEWFPVGKPPSRENCDWGVRTGPFHQMLTVCDYWPTPLPGLPLQQATVPSTAKLIALVPRHRQAQTIYHHQLLGSHSQAPGQETGM